MDEPLPDVVERMTAALNDRDADRVAACVAEDYRSVTPAHPDRNFTGREQVRTNWRAAFENAPDFEVDLQRIAVDDGVVWAECRLRGTESDGSEFAMCGVVIWGVEDDLIQWGRVYLEPVERTGPDSWAEYFEAE